MSRGRSGDPADALPLVSRRGEGVVLERALALRVPLVVAGGYSDALLVDVEGVGFVAVLVALRQDCWVINSSNFRNEELWFLSYQSKLSLKSPKSMLFYRDIYIELVRKRPLGRILAHAGGSI